MFCGKCGKKVNDDAAFCPYCGFRMIRPANAGPSVNAAADVSVNTSGESAENALKNIFLGNIKIIRIIAAVILLVISFLNFWKPYIGFDEYTQDMLKKELRSSSTDVVEDLADDFASSFSVSGTKLSENQIYKFAKLTINTLKDGELTFYEEFQLCGMGKKLLKEVNKAIDAQVKEYADNPNYRINEDAIKEIKQINLGINVTYYLYIFCFTVISITFAWGIWSLIKGRVSGPLPYAVCVTINFAVIFLLRKVVLQNLDTDVITSDILEIFEGTRILFPAYFCVICAILSNVVMKLKLKK